ncbi:MAG: DUF2812 domain-containing protein [Lachnospiraceae bacterium]|nr:DUF2812 domain-containing protein [Lachnospiraceae bacterium]
MRDNDHIKENHAVQYDDLEATAKYLENKAKAGWMLEKVSSGTSFHFVKCEPKDLRFTVEIFSEGSVYDTHTIDSNLEYVEYCKKAGWNFICSAGKLDYFYTEDPNAPEIESDQEMKLKTIEKTQFSLKIAFPILFMLMGIGFLAMQLTMNLNVLLTSAFISSAVMLWVFVGIVYAVNLIRYLTWRGKARKAVREGGQIPANKSHLTFRGAYGLLILFAIIHSAVNVGFGLLYGESTTFVVPLVWIVMLLLIIVSYKLSGFAEKTKMKRGTYKLLSMVVLPLCITGFLMVIIFAIIFLGSEKQSDKLHMDPVVMKAFGDNETFVQRSGSDHHWGHFLLRFDQYTLEAYNADRVKMLEDEEFQKTGVYRIADGEDFIPVTYTWAFDVYQPKLGATYDRLLKEAKAGKKYRTLSINFDFDQAARLPELELAGLTVWTYEERYEDDDYVTYRYLILDGDTIISARCDEALNAEQMQVIKTSFMD